MKTIQLLLTVSLLTPVVRAGLADSDLSPAQKSIQRAEQSVQRAPESLLAWNRLAAAWIERGLEIDQIDAYQQAEEAARQALRMDPRNLRAEAFRIQALFGQRQFEEALQAAERLNQRNPDNVATYGLMVDASLALGLDEKAEKACQWMLDLRPSQFEGLTRAARLRELYGDLDGASDFLNKAYHGLSPDQRGLQSLTLSDLARTLRLEGKTNEAERVLQRALSLVPDSPGALLELAWTRRDQGRLDEAVGLLEKRARVSPGPDRLFDWAELLWESGRRKEAEALFQDFERRARAIQDRPHNANRRLIVHLARGLGQAKEALRMAEREVGRRRDRETLLALAWALHANDRNHEARRRIEGTLSRPQRQTLNSILQTLSNPDSEPFHSRLPIR